MLALLKAFIVASKAHKGQVDKAGKAYIFHPIAVALGVKGYRTKVVALLHDVLEDSDRYTIEDLDFLDVQQKEALLLLTHPSSVDYVAYIYAIKTNAIATAVKIADLQQNSNLDRLPVVTEKDLKRKQKYMEALNILQST